MVTEVATNNTAFKRLDWAITVHGPSRSTSSRSISALQRQILGSQMRQWCLNFQGWRACWRASATWYLWLNTHILWADITGVMHRQHSTSYSYWYVWFNTIQLTLLDISCPCFIIKTCYHWWVDAWKLLAFSTDQRHKGSKQLTNNLASNKLVPCW